MAGHSHWKQIKEHKGTSDEKRGVLFSKLLKAITVAARTEPNPQFNPRLRTTIEKAREYNVPQENIERALQRASKEDANLEEITIEAYGPGGVAILIEAITGNRNRTIQEIKTIIKKHDCKWAEPGSVRWAFVNGEKSNGEQIPKFTQSITVSDLKKIEDLIKDLQTHEDVQKVYHNGTNL